MSLYVIEVPNPAAGADWLTTVPGQYVYDVTGITATLSTIQNPTTLSDSGPNNLPLTVSPTNGSLSFGVTGPFAGGANNLAVAQTQTAISDYVGRSAATALFATAALTYEGWFMATGTPGLDDPFGQSANNDAAPADWAWYINNAAGNPATLRELQGFSTSFQTGSFFTRNVWHHMAFVADGAQWLWYMDGALIGTNPGFQPGGGGTSRVYVGGSTLFGQGFRGRMAAVAEYGTALSGATIAAHAAAGSTAAAYKAAVLADSPVALWMLDSVVSGGTRTVTLDVTDGTNRVGSYPAPFPAGTVTGPITFSWQPRLGSSAQTPAQTTTTVAIPTLILPAGYTIGTRTLDIAPTDQWSNINVWWNSDRMDTRPPESPYVYPPGALLQYHQRETP